MVFSSVTFLFYFLPLFFATYFYAPGIKSKNTVALLFSIIFYAWGEPFFIFALLLLIALNGWAAIRIDAAQGNPRRRRLIAAITGNLAVLFIFKYAVFFLANVGELLAPYGVHVTQPRIALPLGISFFTFHCLSYLIDVYRRQFPAIRDFRTIALYIMFFPQLVAGPIVRYKTIARQLQYRRHTIGRASAGAHIFIIGLAQKVLIADQLGALCEAIFERTPSPHFVESWLGLFAYTIQIYFDFCGYSNMAVGLGLILGFTLPRNFRLPYASLSITEFWRRWHISLSSWLRDYLYIPLGGSRGSTAETYRNLIVVFLLCGLWHGASWNFVLWGVWHGSFLIFERTILGRYLLQTPPAFRWTYTMLVVMGGWVLFRSSDLSIAAAYYKGLVGLNGWYMPDFEFLAELKPICILALLVGLPLAVLPRWFDWPKRLRKLVQPVEPLIAMSLLALTMVWVGASTYSPFLYFRF